MTKCAYKGCGVDFTPKDSRQQFHTHECGQRERDARKRRCPNCKAPGMVDDRFCSSACQWAYAQKRRKGRPPTFTPVIVLLPGGCNPTRSVALPIAPESTERLSGGQTYGEVSRKVWCQRYERCLSHAVSLRWDGFSCRSCEVDEPDINAPRNKGSNWEP